MRVSQAWTLLKAALSGWWEDRGLSMGAAIAFYTVFSLAPMLLLVIAVAGLAFGREAAQGAIVAQLGGLMGPDGATALAAMIRSASSTGSGVFATTVGVITFLLVATGAFVELQDALNRIWRAKPRPESGLVVFIRTRLLSLALILGFGFLMMVSLVLNAAITAAGGYLVGIFPAVTALLRALEFLVSLGVTVVLLAMIYKILPDLDIAWGDVWIGAALTAVLLTIGRVLIGFYIGKSGVASSYGAAASLIIILLWVYYSAQIVLFGAEFTKAYAERHGSRASTG